jgi:hypothetical protein
MSGLIATSVGAQGVVAVGSSAVLASELLPLAMKSRPRKRAATCAVEVCIKNKLDPKIWANIIYLAIRSCQTKSRGFIWELWDIFPTMPRLNPAKKRINPAV